MSDKENRAEKSHIKSRFARLIQHRILFHWRQVFSLAGYFQVKLKKPAQFCCDECYENINNHNRKNKTTTLTATASSASREVAE
jgi:hypothetical protein